MKLSAKDIILITLAVALGGPGTAQALINLAGRYLEKKLAKYFESDFNEETFRRVLRQLKRDGLLEKDRRGLLWFTKRGEKAAKFVRRRLNYEDFKAKQREADTILIFDVPEMTRKKRDYLRIELRVMGFKMLQKSVWIGGGPLPGEFLEYLKELRLLNCIHVFTVKKFGTMK